MNQGMWKGSPTGILPTLCLKITITICLVSEENLVLDQLIIGPLLIFFFILITCLLIIVLILLGEIQSWLVVGVKGLL